jgi:hypothetical protein
MSRSCGEIVTVILLLTDLLRDFLNVFLKIFVLALQQLREHRKLKRICYISAHQVGSNKLRMHFSRINYDIGAIFFRRLV